MIILEIVIKTIKLPLIVQNEISNFVFNWDAVDDF